MNASVPAVNFFFSIFRMKISHKCTRKKERKGGGGRLFEAARLQQFWPPSGQETNMYLGWPHGSAISGASTIWDGADKKLEIHR